MNRVASFAMAIVMAGCGRSGTPRTNGDAAFAGTGGMGAGGNAGVTGAAGGGGTSLAGGTATSDTGGAATGSGGAILLGGTSASSGGTGDGTAASGGIASSGGSLDASGGTTGTGGGGGFASSASAGGSGGQSGSSRSTGGGGSASGGGAGQKSSPSGGSTGTGGAAAGAGGSTGGAAGSGGASGTGGTGGCGGCQSLEVCLESRICVAESVQIPPNPNPFLIDATEVTRGQYAAWLATNPDPKTIWQGPECSWNTSFTPDATCMTRSSVCKGADCANHPQVCIDMCDAVAYCSAIGKHLCSAYEWSNACTSNGINKFTYGNSVGVGQCHDTTEPNSSTTVPVGTMPGCQSSVPGFAGIFDLIGNVSEWVADCTGSAGATDGCQSRGGSFGLSEVMPDCSQSVGAQRAYFSDRIGFRCSISLVH